MKVTIYLLFSVGIDWSDGRSYLQDVYGSLDKAMNSEHVSEGLRKDWRSTSHEGYSGRLKSKYGERIRTCTYFDIYMKDIEI